MKSLFLFAFLAALGDQVVHGDVLKSAFNEIPHGWKHVSTASDSQSITLTIALRQQNLHTFYNKLQEISDPLHAAYGKWMDKIDVDNLLKPSHAAKQTVSAWLQQNGIKHIHKDNDDFHVRFTTDIRSANKLLKAEYHNFEREGVTKTRTLKYSIPDGLDRHIDVVWPTTYLGRSHPSSVKLSSGVSKKLSADPLAKDTVPSNCSSGLTLACVQNYYNIHYTPVISSGSKVGFASFLNASAQQSDFALYQGANNLPLRTFSTQSINSGVDHQEANYPDTYEANLDSQNLGGLSSPLPLTEFIAGGLGPLIPNVDEPAGQDTNEPWLDYINALLAQSNKYLPQVISHSYGDEEVTVPQDYATRVCNGFAQLGIRGITVLVSSGDIGVGASCKTANNATRFNAMFPADCPYVTSVGGTAAQNTDLALSFVNEGAWTGSSGGFSDFFGRPWYQTSVVQTYLSNYAGNKTTAYAPYVNFSGRASPDVSVLAGLPGYIIYDQGQQSLGGGTSASVPIWGAIVGLLNSARLKRGYTSMGFINPFLYSQQASAGLRDITKGASIGCNGVNQQYGQPLTDGAIVPNAAWNATTGWDPSTGLGVPKSFDKLLQAALSIVVGI